MAKFIVSGDKIKIVFEYEALTTKVQPIIEDCAESLWVEETEDEVVTNPFSKATNQEKLNIVDEYIKDIIVNLANSQKIKVAQDKAKETAEETLHNI